MCDDIISLVNTKWLNVLENLPNSLGRMTITPILDLGLIDYSALLYNMIG